MAYEVADIEYFQWTDATFGATTVSHVFIGPRGKVGFVRDIEVDVAVLLVGTTTVPEVMVGFAAGDFTYGRYRLGSTLILGYGIGFHRASNELITGNPPRVATDFASHVVLDGGPYGSSAQNIVGGSASTVAPLGRIPAAGRYVQNVINGTGNVCRVFLNSVQDLAVGGTVRVQGVQGATGTGTNGTILNGCTAVISALSTAANWIELTGVTFGGAYTQGGLVDPVVTVSNTAGVGGSPAGGGTVRVKVQWVGAETV